ALSIAVFDFVFVPPYYTFNVHDTAYFLTFGVMLAVALVMSGLTARIREQREEARERERRTAALYAMERELSTAAEREAVVAIADLAAAALERRLQDERNEQARGAIEAERLRTALLSSLSHDLRTPLATIEGAASSLLEEPGALSGDAREELLQSIL